MEFKKIVKLLSAIVVALLCNDTMQAASDYVRQELMRADVDHPQRGTTFNRAYRQEQAAAAAAAAADSDPSDDHATFMRNHQAFLAKSQTFLAQNKEQFPHLIPLEAQLEQHTQTVQQLEQEILQKRHGDRLYTDHERLLAKSAALMQHGQTIIAQGLPKAEGAKPAPTRPAAVPATEKNFLFDGDSDDEDDTGLFVPSRSAVKSAPARPATTAQVPGMALEPVATTTKQAERLSLVFDNLSGDEDDSEGHYLGAVNERNSRTPIIMMDMSVESDNQGGLLGEQYLPKDGNDQNHEEYFSPLPAGSAASSRSESPISVVGTDSEEDDDQGEQQTSTTAASAEQGDDSNQYDSQYFIEFAFNTAIRWDTIERQKDSINDFYDGLLGYYQNDLEAIERDRELCLKKVSSY